MRTTRLLFVLAIGSIVGASGGVAAHRLVPRSPLAAGIQIGERRAPDRGAAEWLAARRETARSRVVRFRHEDQVFESTLGQAGVEIDVAATLERARAFAHTGSMFQRLRESEAARRGEIDVPLVWFVDRKRARALLESWAPALAKEPVDARIDLDQHRKIADLPGAALDVETSIDELEKGRHDDEETVSLIVRSRSAKVMLADLARVDVEKVLSAHETTFVTWGGGAGRAINIRNAAARIDGVMLMPGEILSFNEKVGPRTRERGFALAPEIQGDELQNGYGGGTCQVSSTLHAASLFGALDIVERQSHSRPSSYTKMGLDATVSYPLADLKIRNNMSFPILIHAFLPKPTAIRVEILGGDPVAKVEYSYGVGSSEGFVRRVTVKHHFPPGKRVRHQKGIRGYDVTSLVKVTYNDGRVIERKYFSGYRPAPEVYWVAPGYDTEELPPLPEHATGVEGRRLDGQATARAATGRLGG